MNLYAKDALYYMFAVLVDYANKDKIINYSDHEQKRPAHLVGVDSVE